MDTLPTSIGWDLPSSGNLCGCRGSQTQITLFVVVTSFPSLIEGRLSCTIYLKPIPMELFTKSTLGSVLFIRGRGGRKQDPFVEQGSESLKADRESELWLEPRLNKHDKRSRARTSLEEDSVELMA